MANFFHKIAIFRTLIWENKFHKIIFSHKFLPFIIIIIVAKF